MNAIPAVSQAPSNGDLAQASGAASADSAVSGANGQNFAAELTSAGATSTRKPALNKAHGGGSSGGHLPAPGNPSPPPASSPVPPAAAAQASSAANTAGGAASGAAAGTAAAGTATGAVSNKAAATAAAIPSAETKAADLHSGGALLDPPVAASAGPAVTGLGMGFAQALGLPVSDPGQTRAQSGGAAGIANLASNAQGTIAAGADLPAAAPNATQGAGAAQADATMGLQTAKGAVAAGGAPAPARAGAAAGGTPISGLGRAAAGSANKPVMGAAAASADTAAINAATSAPSGAGGSAATATGPVAGTNSDATAQTAAAATMSAAAAGAVASKDAGFAGAADSNSKDLAAPTAGTVVRDAAGSNGAPAPALAGSATPPAAAAAATAALNAHAITALANASTSDKHARDGSGDSLLPGASGGVAGAAQLSINAASATDAAPTPTLKVAAGVETPEFGQGLADRVSYMVDNNLNGAKLQVNPPQLGPIEVRIAVQGDHAQVWLTSHSAVTRDALESSAPKLREMLGIQGFGQVSVDISQRSFQERSAYSQPYDWTPSANRGASTAPVSAAPASVSRISSGAVDAYA